MIKAVIFDMYETLITQFESPLYYGTQMAEDVGLTPETFLPSWRRTEVERGTGKMTFEQSIELVLMEHKLYSNQLYHKIVDKRIAIQADCFQHLHEEIIPMLSELKEKGMKIGLISNCFSEEAKLIRESKLYPFFDVACLSYEEGIMKPEKEIFYRCMRRLGVQPEECLYVGDGGSQELETARGLGMQAVQATWYRSKKGEGRMAAIRPEFQQVECPLEIVRKLC
ncbi:MAG: HAD-IA family hydrolase [Agathobacter sp.]|nr:HAD-IA family hydrolase [Agathobacter sp.]